MSILEVSKQKNDTSLNKLNKSIFMGTKITKICVTNDKISARGGLPLFLRYIEKTRAYGLISRSLLSLLTINKKGLSLKQFLKQMFAFLMDGTKLSITEFDRLKQDEGYTALLENKSQDMASSHQIKRFFRKISLFNSQIFNNILNELFIWRLQIEKPAIIELGIDTMVMDNDSAKKREGSEPTYKNVKGFQPLHISWGRFLVDVLFREGSAHSNHGTDYIDRVKSIVKLIRKRYSADVPIIICADSGFADQKAYEYFEETLGIHYITTGKIYNDIKEYVGQIPVEDFGEFRKNKAVWKYTEFGNKLKSWTKFRRCIFTSMSTDQEGQYLLEFNKPDSIIYTNIGTCKQADDKLRAAGGEHYFESQTILQKSHERGADELIHRSLKEFATKEQLPFQSFGMNRAYYFMLVITHFLYEAFKEDVTVNVIPITSYPNTFRRIMIDFAAKITSGAGYIKLNVTKTIYNTLNIIDLWEKCQSPPQIQMV